MGWPGPMTHRQYLGWREWLRADARAPDRGDWYTMQLTMTVANMFAKKPFDLDSFVLKYRGEDDDNKSRRSSVPPVADAEPTDGPPRVTAADVAAFKARQAAARIAAAAGTPVRHVVKDRDGNVVSDTGPVALDPGQVIRDAPDLPPPAPRRPLRIDRPEVPRPPAGPADL